MRQEEQAEAEARSRKFGAILTHEDRMEWIAQLKRGNASRAHIERLKIIYAPFPNVWRSGGNIGFGSALPWAGTIVVDTFFGTVGKPRGKHGDGREDMDGLGDERGGYTGLYARAVERALR